MSRAYRLLVATAPLALALAACVPGTDETHHELRLEEDDATAFVAQDEELARALTAASDDPRWKLTPVIEASGPFDRIGIRYDTFGDVEVQARTSHDGGETFGSWERLQVTFHEERAHNAHVDVEKGETHVQLRFRVEEDTSIDFLAVETFEFPTGVEIDEGDEDIGTSRAGLAASGVAVSRSAWGARPHRCSGSHYPNRMTVHHTVTPNNDSASMPARVRQIQNFHMNTRGWCDVGYHFLVGQDGRVYQGRPERLIGAHVGGHNTGNAGVSFIGTFTSVAPSNRQMAAGARILKSISDEYGIALNRTKVLGHRQQGSTSCPGGALYARLSNLVAQARGTSAGGGFCATHGGTWCDGNDVVTCNNGNEVSRTHCAHGCQSMPSGTPDRCASPPSFCSSHGGTWCDGNDVVTCNNGAEVSRTSCQHGCQSMPSGTPDQCYAPPSFCSSHGGTWCDGNDVVVCSNGNEVSRTRCQHGCQSMPSGTPDQCYAPPGSYADVPSGHFAFNAAERLRELGALYGCASGQFCPDQPITRAELAFMLSKLDGQSFNAPSSPTFSDVPRSHWSFASVEEVASRGVIQGCTGGTFCPFDGVSRAAGAVFIRRSLGLPDGNPATPTFTDVPLSHWASNAIERLAARRDVRGCAQNPARYCPSDPLTRAQAAVIAYRAFNL